MTPLTKHSKSCVFFPLGTVFFWIRLRLSAPRIVDCGSSVITAFPQQEWNLGLQSCRAATQWKTGQTQTWENRGKLPSVGLGKMADIIPKNGNSGNPGFSPVRHFSVMFFPHFRSRVIFHDFPIFPIGPFSVVCQPRTIAKLGSVIANDAFATRTRKHSDRNAFLSSQNKRSSPESPNLENVQSRLKFLISIK